MRRRQAPQSVEVPVDIAGGPCVDVWAPDEDGEKGRLTAMRRWQGAKHAWAQSQPAYSEALRRVGFRPPYRGA